MIATFSRLIGFFVLLSILFAATPATAKPSREYYEMRVYTLASAEQQQQADQYWEKAAIPALNRAGVAHVGVFHENDEKEGRKLYVLIPFKSLKQWEQVWAKVSADAAYQQMAKPYIAASPDQPPYVRCESWLMRAFKGWPRLTLPTTTAPKAERVYEYRIYESPTEERGENKIAMFNEGNEIEIFTRLGFEPVYFAQTIAGGQQPNLTYMTSFANRAERDAHWDAFRKDAAWVKMKSLPEYAKNVSKSIIHLLTPAAYSQI